MRVKCPICFDPCLDSDGVDQPIIVTLRCGHIFHQKCVTDWYKTNKSCAMCRKKSTLQAAVRLFPQFDDEPSDAEQRLMSRIDEMETKLVMLRSEVESLKAENRQLKSSVENTKDKYVDYKEFIEDFANDLMKQAKKIDQFRLNMSDPHREEDVLMRSKATFYTKYARKRSLPQPGNENMMKKKRNE